MADSENLSKGTVVVAGATGYLGGYVVRALHSAGWRVRALARHESKLKPVREFCDDVFVAQATQRETLGGLFDGAEAAFSSIGIRSFSRRPTYEEVDYGANINLLEEAEAAGVRRFVFVSVLDGDIARRVSPLVDARERVVDRLRASSMEDVVLRPTGFFNDMGEIFEMARRGRVWMVGSGDTRINPIHGADLAELVSLALERKDPQADLPAGGPDVFTQRQIADLAFSVLGKPAKYGHINPRLLRLACKVIHPFNKNMAALALMFSLLGERDGVAPTYGGHRLEDYYRELASA
jgi:uncharacterized protein YbjT (DUF2867 family)